MLVIETSWPGTTIEGEIRVVSGELVVSASAGDEFQLNIVIGPTGGAPEECEYTEFPLSRGQAQALARVLGT